MLNLLLPSELTSSSELVWGLYLSFLLELEFLRRLLLLLFSI